MCLLADCALARRPLAWLVCASVLAAWPASAAPASEVAIVHSPAATSSEALASRELRRYVYELTGVLADVIASDALPDAEHAVVVARSDRALAGLAAGCDVRSLGEQAYLLTPVTMSDATVQLVVGGGDAGVLYGADRLAERDGARFLLDRDVLPDARREVSDLPSVRERREPLFELRGIQPFHDFPEGPDWWTEDDYKAYIAQLPKLGMNFIGLHTYPEAAPCAEPTVWIGLPEDLDAARDPVFSYPASYMNTVRGIFGYEAMPTSSYHCGASSLFPEDAYGADVMRGHCPQPVEPEACNEVFCRTGDMLRGAFSLARDLGVRTCVGTEAPLTIPQRVRERLVAQGLDPDSPAVRQRLYEGIFRRAATYPVDYYWLWTPEGWTWSGTSPEQVESTLRDLQAAAEAAKTVGAPFGLATCGWVLGPESNRSLFDESLPADWSLSCINRNVGHSPVEPGFADVRRQGKWAIPWLEDDPALASPQLWVGRMREDALLARTYGCNGLMGIHWRTRVLGPNVQALARAGWEQSDWPQASEAEGDALGEGAIGGQYAAYGDAEIADTEDDPLYQTVRYNVRGYQLGLPDGRYTVTLRFCEPAYEAKGLRVFDVSLEGRKVIQALDIFATVGKNRALDYTFEDVAVDDGMLSVGFGYIVEYPSIAAIEVVGAGFERRVNCAGPAYGDYAADWPAAPPEQDRRGVVCDDFYADWARHEFGPEIADAAARIFASVDGRLPRPSTWLNGPGALVPAPAPWAEVAPQYALGAELERLEPLVRGAGNRARFTYWLETFRFLREQGRVRCAWGAYDAAMERVRAADPADQPALARREALPLRVQLVERVTALCGHLLATVETPGELGTIANLEQHTLPTLLHRPGEELAAILGEPLPPEAMLPMSYSGPTRVILPTARGSLRRGEPLRVTALVLAERPVAGVVLYWRPLGEGAYRRDPLAHIARGVYRVELPAEEIAGRDFEYFVRAWGAAGPPVFAPATAPDRNRTVVIILD